MAKSLDELREELEQLRKELKDLTGEVPVKFDTNSVEEVEKAIKAINTQIKEAKEETKSLSEQFKNSYERLRGITSEMKGQATPITKTRNAFKQIERSAQDLLIHSQKINTLSDKELANVNKKLKKQIEIANQEGERLLKEKGISDDVKAIQDSIKEDERYKTLSKEEQLDILLGELDGVRNLSTEQRAILSNYIEQTSEIEGHKSVFEEILDQSKKELELREEANKKLGVTGALLKGISKIPVLGNLIDAQEALAKAQEESRKESSTTASVMSTAFSSLGASLRKNLSDPLVNLSLAFMVLQKMVKLAFKFDDRTVQISRNFGMSYQNAARLNKEFLEISSNSSNALATAENYKEAYFNINNSLGTTAKLSKKQLEDQTQILKTTGLTAEEAATVAEYSILTGQSQEDVYDGVMAINTGVISNQKVLKETLSVSGELAANYRNNPQLIAQAVAQSQRLGLTLEDTKDMSKGLLDFQSSIEAELQAELMTGKNLNLERARYLALMGKTDEAAKEMLENITLEEFQTTMNVKQREALARAIGMSVDQLNNALVKQDKLSKLTKEQRIEAEALSKMQESGAEKLASAGEKLSNAFSSLFAGTGGELINKFADLVQSFASSGLGKALTGIGAAAVLATGVIGLGRILKSLIIDGAMPVIIKGASSIGDMFGGKGKGLRLKGRFRLLRRSLSKLSKRFGFLGKVIGGTTSMFSGMGSKISSLFSGGKNIASTAISKGKDVISSAGKGIANAASKGGNIASTAISKGKDVISSAGKGIANTASKAGGWLKSIGSKALDFGSSVIGKVKDVASNLNPFKSISKFFKGGGVLKFLGKALKRVPILTTFLEGLFTLTDIKDLIASGEVGPKLYNAVGKRAFEGIGGILGSIGGGALGSLIPIPGVGTALGAIGGDFLGRELGGLIADAIQPTKFGKWVVENVSSTEQPKVKLATGGIVTSETRATVGEAGPEAVIPLDAFYRKIDELILAVRESGNISVDGIKLNNRVAMNTVKLGS